MTFPIHMLAILLVLPMFACQKSQNEQSLAALKSHIEGQNSGQASSDSGENHEGEAWITDDMNEGVRPPTAHITWQNEQGESKSGSQVRSLPPRPQKTVAQNPSRSVPALENADHLMRQGLDQKAMELYLSLCQAGKAEACHRFGYYMSRSGNWQNAHRFYQVACENGLEKSCNNLGWAAEQRGDLAKAQDFYSWACLKHHKTSCQSLRRVTRKLKNSRSVHPSHQQLR